MAGTALKITPLDELHRELGARMVPFAGWSMPLQYPAGIMAEHRWCRSSAALFDVSHMGQLILRGPDPAAALERLLPGNILDLKEGRARYTQLTNERGGILDDLIVSNAGDHLFVVVNAGGRDQVIAHLQDQLAPEHEVSELTDRALLALQGPKAVEVIARMAPEVRALRFMMTGEMSLSGLACRVSRLGYTGEDGVEISVPAGNAAKLARTLLAAEEVEPAGLGARDSLRLEAGLCLYGHDIDTGTTPVEASLGWSIGKRRRAEGGFPGDEIILRQLEDGAPRKLVGIRLEGRAPAREGAEIRDGEGTAIGQVTSGGFAPSLNAPIAMGYVTRDYTEPGTGLALVVRGKELPGRVAPLPFVEQRYQR